MSNQGDGQTRPLHTTTTDRRRLQRSKHLLHRRPGAEHRRKHVDPLVPTQDAFRSFECPPATSARSSVGMRWRRPIVTKSAPSISGSAYEYFATPTSTHNWFSTTTASQNALAPHQYGNLGGPIIKNKPSSSSPGSMNPAYSSPSSETFYHEE